MAAVRMVLLRTVPSAFHARVLAARLGADGIVAQLRGSLDGPYPIGDVMVFVGEDDLDTARELLLADEVEDAFERQHEADVWALDGRRARATWALWTSLFVLVSVWATLMMRVFAL